MQFLEHTDQSPKVAQRRPGARVVVTRALSNRWKRYVRELNRSRKKCSEESIHDLRVSLRKLIAVLELIEPVVQSKQLLWLRKRLKKQFDGCGPLRDIQVQLIGIANLSSCYPGLEPLITALRKKETRCIKQTFLLVNHTRLKRIEKSIDALQRMIRIEMNRANAVVHAGVLVASVSRAFMKVQRYKQLLDRNDTGTIHTMRVAFKRFRYQAELLQPLFRSLTPELLLSMHEFQSRMGDVQDIEVLIASVNKFALKNKRLSDGESLLRVHQELQRQRQARIENFFHHLQEVDGYWPVADAEGKGSSWNSSS